MERSSGFSPALTLRLVFKLPLRQAQGFLQSVLPWMGVDLEAPDYTTLSRRSQHLDVESTLRSLRLAPIRRSSCVEDGESRSPQRVGGFEPLHDVALVHDPYAPSDQAPAFW